MNAGEMIYESLSGSTSGHMAAIPNHPMMYSLLSLEHKGLRDNTHACTKQEFITFFEKVIFELKKEKK